MREQTRTSLRSGEGSVPAMKEPSNLEPFLTLFLKETHKACKGKKAFEFVGVEWRADRPSKRVVQSF